MASFLSQAASNPLLREYAQGRARDAISKIADFVSPSVEVSSAVGRYKIFDEKNRFYIPSTERAVGGAAPILTFTRTDGTYNCTPNALDCPVDVAAQSSEDAQAELQDAADEAAGLAALSHEKKVLDLALTVSATDQAWDANTDPVEKLNALLAGLVKASGMGGKTALRVLFGAEAWLHLLNHPAIAKKIIVGGGRGASVGLATPTLENVSAMLFGNPECATCYSAHDSKPGGVTASYDFLLAKKILIFVASAKPSRRDPSFMKSFRLRGRWMVPGVYQTADGRNEVAKLDWSEDVKITNSAACKSVNVTNAPTVG